MSYEDEQQQIEDKFRLLARAAHLTHALTPDANNSRDSIDVAKAESIDRLEIYAREFIVNEVSKNVPLPIEGEEDTGFSYLLSLLDQPIEDEMERITIRIGKYVNHGKESSELRREILSLTAPYASKDGITTIAEVRELTEKLNSIPPFDSNPVYYLNARQQGFPAKKPIHIGSVKQRFDERLNKTVKMNFTEDDTAFLIDDLRALNTVLGENIDQAKPTFADEGDIQHPGDLSKNQNLLRDAIEETKVLINGIDTGRADEALKRFDGDARARKLDADVRQKELTAEAPPATEEEVSRKRPRPESEPNVMEPWLTQPRLNERGGRTRQGRDGLAD